jgi:hypothetical protein
MPPPGSGTDELLGRLRDAAPWHEWLELGLGDGPLEDAGDDPDLDVDVVDEAAGQGDAA